MMAAFSPHLQMAGQLLEPQWPTKCKQLAKKILTVQFEANNILIGEGFCLSEEPADFSCSCCEHRL